tara:strand:+ start:73 stop:387 length:315 start_codon:yes stop_codon:yes gene_type:complete
MKKHDNALKTIGELSKILNVPIYVLRFWEKKIKMISPIKKKNGMRYFDSKQIELIKTVKHLLYVDKYSIEGATKVLKNKLDNSNEKCSIISELKTLVNEIDRIV